VLLGDRLCHEGVHRFLLVFVPGTTVLPQRVRHIRAEHGSTTERPRIEIGTVVEPQLLTDAGVSGREVEVLALVGEHRTNAEIAASLFISVRTVESHVSSLLRKLGVSDRRALADLAAELRPTAGEPAAAPAVSVTSSPSLPSPLTSFVGRAAERTALAEALAHQRLVTAVGPGGVGKTRLALAVAADVTDDYADGAWYVDLVPVTDAAMVGAAVAGALGFGEELGRSPTETVVTRFADAEALVVMDNCEHLVDGVVEFVERLLSACPRVVVLATSRARLVVPFESVFPVPGLSLPVADGDGVHDQQVPTGQPEGDAVALFVDRAAMTGWSPSSADDVRRIAAICDGLDGIALAIELAAARLATLGLDGLEAGLANRLGLLAGGHRMDERHRSVRSALDWSYGLLDAADQAVLRRTSVFAGLFTLGAATEVAGYPPLGPDQVAAPLAGLADHSLLVVSSDPGGTHYRMLETVREYCGEQLAEVGELFEVHGRHLSWCLATAAGLSADRVVLPAPGPESRGRARAEGSIEAAFDVVADDLRAALSWAAGEPDRRADAHDLALRLAELSFARGMSSEAQRRYEQASETAVDDAAAAQALQLSAGVALCRLMGDEAVRLFLAGAQAARRAGDDRRTALDLIRAAEVMDRSPGLMAEVPPPGEVDALLAEAQALAGRDAHVAAAILTVQAGSDALDLDPVMAGRAVELARQVGDPRLESAALDQLTVAQLSAGDVLAGAASSRQRLELVAPLASDVDVAFELSDALHMASLTSIGAGDFSAARHYAQQRHDLSIHREDDHLVVNWLLVLAALAGDWDRAIELGERFRVGWERAGRLPLRGFAAGPAAVAMVYGLRGDDEARRTCLATVAAMRRSVGDPLARTTGYGPTFEAVIALHRGEVDGAVAALADEPETLTLWNNGVWRQWYAAVWAEAGVLADLADHADRLTRARSITDRNPIATAIVDRAEALVGGNTADLLRAAADLGAAGCRYQQARTLVLVGGDERAEGDALLAAMGAAPMAV
jgi:predicted ATPase/DNA-binding CsgD family transcriptional regulator